MAHTVEKVDPPELREEERVPASEIQKTLSSILQSPPFHASKQSQELLQYIVVQTLSGHTEMLKERIIGANVFDRRPDYDTNDDPIVRARAGEVRKRLAVYYQTARDESVRISIPPGSFRAIFEWAERHPAHSPVAALDGSVPSQPLVEPGYKSTPTDLTGADLASSSARFRGLRWWIAIAVCVAFLAWPIQHYFATSDERAFNRFWSPIFGNPHAVLIYIGSNAVYELSTSYIDAYYKDHPRNQSDELALESYIPLSPGTKIDAQDLYPAKDTFVTIGDVAATTNVVSLLVRSGKRFDVRFGNDVAFGDLRESPTILIGAHNNSWTLAMTDNLRYVFDGRSSIVDRSDPQRHWSTTANFKDDYAIVSRILSSRTGTTVLTAAGIGHAGTRAAAEFLTSPQSIALLAKALPKGWEKKNIQIVLHTNVINQLPGAPDVVATYCW